MKITVEYSESIHIVEGVWRKIGVVIDSEEQVYTEADAEAVYNKARDYVKKWHWDELSKGQTNPANTVSTDQKNQSHSAPPVIQVEKNTSATANAIIRDIYECKTIREVEAYRLLRTDPDINDAYNTMMIKLSL